VKVNFLRTVNVKVAKPVGRSYWSPVQFFSCLISFWMHTSLCIWIC